MAWFKVDDGFWSHPKTATLSDSAVTLWVRAGAYSCQHLTDGVIARPVLRLVGESAAADELVDAALWVEVDGGWRFHDWGEYQETSETVKKRRSDARDRQRRAREVREQKRAMSQRESRVTEGVSNAVSSLPPTRPDPTRPDQLLKAKLSRIDDAFERAYKSWPKKVEKKKSHDKFRLLAKKHDPDWLTDQVIRFGTAYANTTESRYVPALVVWLNGERWTDELPTASTDVINAQWEAAMGDHKPDPCAGGHKWTVDGECVRCLTTKEGDLR